MTAATEPYRFPHTVARTEGEAPDWTLVVCECGFEAPDHVVWGDHAIEEARKENTLRAPWDRSCRGGNPQTCSPECDTFWPTLWHWHAHAVDVHDPEALRQMTAEQMTAIHPLTT